MRTVLAYDVAEDRKRQKLSELLLDYGDRVQKSVFEADLDPEALKEVLARATKYLSEEDSLRAYPLCSACAARREVRGRVEVEEPRDRRIL